VVQSTIFKTCRIHRPSRSLIHTFHSQSKGKRQKSIRLRLEGRSTPTKPTAESDCNLPSLQALGYNTSLCSTSYCLVATGNCGTVDHIQNLPHTQTVPYTHCSHSTHNHSQLMCNLNFIFKKKLRFVFSKMFTLHTAGPDCTVLRSDHHSGCHCTFCVTASSLQCYESPGTRHKYRGPILEETPNNSITQFTEKTTNMDKVRKLGWLQHVVEDMLLLGLRFMWAIILLKFGSAYGAHLFNTLALTKSRLRSRIPCKYGGVQGTREHPGSSFR
jgi:hypothetical protein